MLGERWIQTGVRLEAEGVYSCANMNIVKHCKIHKEATQGSRYKYITEVRLARVESQRVDNPLRGSDMEMLSVKSKIPTVWADGGLGYLQP